MGKRPSIFHQIIAVASVLLYSGCAATDIVTKKSQPTENLSDKEKIEFLLNDVEKNFPNCTSKGRIKTWLHALKGFLAGNKNVLSSTQSEDKDQNDRQLFLRDFEGNPIDTESERFIEKNYLKTHNGEHLFSKGFLEKLKIPEYKKDSSAQKFLDSMLVLAAMGKNPNISPKEYSALKKYCYLRNAISPKTFISNIHLNDDYCYRIDVKNLVHGLPKNHLLGSGEFYPILMRGFFFCNREEVNERAAKLGITREINSIFDGVDEKLVVNVLSGKFPGNSRTVDLQNGTGVPRKQSK